MLHHCLNGNGVVVWEMSQPAQCICTLFAVRKSEEMLHTVHDSVTFMQNLTSWSIKLLISSSGLGNKEICTPYIPNVPSPCMWEKRVAVAKEIWGGFGKGALGTHEIPYILSSAPENVIFMGRTPRPPSLTLYTTFLVNLDQIFLWSSKTSDES